MDRGAWQTTVHGVADSRTRLSACDCTGVRFRVHLIHAVRPTVLTALDAACGILLPLRPALTSGEHPRASVSLRHRLCSHLNAPLLISSLQVVFFQLV